MEQTAERIRPRLTVSRESHISPPRAERTERKKIIEEEPPKLEELKTLVRLPSQGSQESHDVVEVTPQPEEVTQSLLPKQSLTWDVDVTVDVTVNNDVYAGMRFDKHTGGYNCRCSTCVLKRQRVKKADVKQLNKHLEDLANYEGTEQSFTWLIQQLAEISAKQGVRINIPDMAVFRWARINFRIFPGPKDGFLKMINQGDKLKMTPTYKEFLKVVTNRYKESKLAAGVQIFRKAPTLSSKGRGESEYGQERVLLRYTSDETKENDEKMQPKHEEGPLRVMLEDEFRKAFVDAPSKALWKNIVYVQTCVKVKHGIGESMIVHYYSHLHENSPAIEALKESCNQNNIAEEEFLMQTNPTGYCNMICDRISYFFAIFMKLELLRIQAEFLKDDNGKIWLIHATRISLREINAPDIEEEIRIEQQQLVPPEFADDPNQELQEYHNETGEMTSKATKLMNILDAHYDKIKQKSGINDLLKGEPPDVDSN